MVGILTFHRAVNYGAVLQTYALQGALNDLKIENEVLDYRCPFIEAHYNPKPSVSPIHVKHFFKEVTQMPIKKRARESFDLFLSKNIKMSEKLEKNGLCSVAEKYDVIITGSDQVWNMAVTGEDTVYALDFAKKNVRKVSYAASLGPAEMKAEYKAKLTPCLKQYDSISVREPAAKAFVEEISEKNVKVDVDPTILLPTEKWESLADKSNLAYKNFIFVYTMQPSDILYNLAQNLAKKEELQIYSLSMVDNSRKLGTDMRGAKIEDFLWMIKHARYVVTNSFHGLLFALRFHKQLYWAFQQGKHMSNPRFDMLIEQYGIDCRCCSKELGVEQCTELDYNHIDSIMSHQRNESLQNLRLSIVGEQ